MPSFIVHGGKPLRGQVAIGGSKNAALPILAATLLTDQKCIIKNVPDIEDVHTMLAILRSLGAEFSFQNHTLEIQTRHIEQGKIPENLACKMRASILLLGALIARTGRAQLPYPGGCVLGTRPIDTHEDVLRQLGIKRLPSRENEVIFEGKPQAGEVILPEFSVTGTENAILAAALAEGQTVIRLAAVEPHVQDLCRFLKALGIGISGIGTHTIKIRNKKASLAPHGATHSITPDYLEAGTFILAAALTRGDVIVKNVVLHDLDALWNLLKEMGVNFEIKGKKVHVKPAEKIKACKRLQTNVFPGYPTDLQPLFVVLMTQAEGESFVHETLFEGRFAYFPDLIKMGAKIKTLNPHEAIISGPVKLAGNKVKSWDIRAGAAMILAALAASGKTEVCDIHYIDRGYERFDEKLRKLRADIVRLP